ncbi:hypothetical protein F2Q70_00025203 [Brassica cretica]|uniref:Uncharacterized protein n=1 Tax=Brassica cretica TaxID=69181 RepID=A0A8S9LGH2_BRACR|nr:hypothetical protein F2Q70_00025206 [Brassica cretica]KAF2604488.1 hypothetical protein F2Q70_00025203 [Brassica cretica]
MRGGDNRGRRGCGRGGVGDSRGQSYAGGGVGKPVVVRSRRQSHARWWWWF